MATKAKRHLHKYHRILLAGTQVWACAQGDCNHYMPAHMSAMVPGKNSICWSCNEPMVLDSNNMQDDKPKCDNCRIGSLIEVFDSINFNSSNSNKE